MKMDAPFVILSIIRGRVRTTVRYRKFLVPGTLEALTEVFCPGQQTPMAADREVGCEDGAFIILIRA